MFRLACLALTAGFLLAALPAAAGEDPYDPCEHSTQECLDYMAQRMKDSGWVGVELEPVEGGGLEVLRVIAGSPAEAAGIREGDILKAINGFTVGVENPELEEDRKNWKPGAAVTWSMAREGNPRDLKLTLAAMPADVLARYIGQHMLRHANAALAAEGDEESAS